MRRIYRNYLIEFYIFFPFIQLVLFIVNKYYRWRESALMTLIVTYVVKVRLDFDPSEK